MLSFLLSLSVVDLQQRRWRTSQHSIGHESFWFRLTHPSWLNSEPYQDSRDSTWKQTDKRGTWNTGEDAFHGWYGRKKKRAIAKMEFGDAFELRGRVIYALLAWTLISGLALTYAAQRAYAWLVGS